MEKKKKTVRVLPLKVLWKNTAIVLPLFRLGLEICFDWVMGLLCCGLGSCSNSMRVQSFSLWCLLHFLSSSRRLSPSPSTSPLWLLEGLQLFSEEEEICDLYEMLPLWDAYLWMKGPQVTQGYRQEGDRAGKGSSVYFYFTLVSLAIVLGGKTSTPASASLSSFTHFLPLYSPLSLHLLFLLLTSVLMVNMSGGGGLWSETTAERTVIVQALWMCRCLPSLLTSPGLQRLRLSCAGAHGQTSAARASSDAASDVGKRPPPSPILPHPPLPPHPQSHPHMPGFWGFGDSPSPFPCWPQSNPTLCFPPIFNPDSVFLLFLFNFSPSWLSC